MPAPRPPTTAFTTLAVLARSKMHAVFGSGARDSSGLHRWVLLKNSLVRSEPALGAKSADPSVHTGLADDLDADDDDADDEPEADEDVFTFPILGAAAADADADASEADWLDSLLETLGDDGDEDAEQASLLAFDDDDGQPLTPFPSPASSSDDLAAAPRPPPIAIPYPIPYPPLVFSYGHDRQTAPAAAPLGPISPSLDDALPYPFFDGDDTEDMPVPDAIEDTSDDESDAPMTPSSVSSLSLVRSAVARAGPRIYVDADDAAFFPSYEPDPLPFADEHHNLGMAPFRYQEC